MRFQTIAISAAVALSIVVGGLALQLAIARRTKPTAQPATSAQKESPIAKRNSPAKRQSQRATIPQPNSQPTSSPTAETKLSAITISPVPTQSPQPSASSKAFNHLPYAEADPARLRVAGTFIHDNFQRTESLDLEAANAFIIMVAEAQAQGVNLMPISGFRTAVEQQELFAKQTERYGSEKAAARLSAPANYSEHHTGYAIDIGDSDRPETDLNPQFADTTAYQWLLNNAYIFGFEQSFPPDNPQGLSFEPWHWRYIQSERAAQIFQSAKESAADPTRLTETQPQP